MPTADLTQVTPDPGHGGHGGHGTPRLSYLHITTDLPFIAATRARHLTTRHHSYHLIHYRPDRVIYHRGTGTMDHGRPWTGDMIHPCRATFRQKLFHQAWPTRHGVRNNRRITSAVNTILNAFPAQLHSPHASCRHAALQLHRAHDCFITVLSKCNTK